MSNKKKFFVLVLAAVVVALNIYIFSYRTPASGVFGFFVEMKADHEDVIQLYYGENTAFQEANSEKIAYTEVGEYQELEFHITSWAAMVRLDLGTDPGEYQIRKMYLQYGDTVVELSPEIFSDSLAQQQIASVRSEDGQTVIETSGTDPFLAVMVDSSALSEPLEREVAQSQMMRNIAVLAVLDLGILVLFLLRKKLMVLPMELLQNRRLILKLSVNDFKTKYAGSYLGIVWAFIQPIVTILVYWFVFSVGLRSGNVDNYPFVLYLTTGIIPWFFFQDALNGGTNALLEYNYLVKKVVFKISILPIVKIISAGFVHVFFVAFALVLCSGYGYFPTPYVLQLIYYAFCGFCFVLALVYATSAIVVFFRDLTQIINILLQVGVWLTPIMWDINSVMADHPLVIKLFKLNPMYYIVTGYRDSMLGHVSVMAHVSWGLYFWVVTAVLFGIGAFIFKRLKPHFADVL